MSAPSTSRFDNTTRAGQVPMRVSLQLVDAEWTRSQNQGELRSNETPANTGKPSVGLEPTTPSLPWKCLSLADSKWRRR